MLDPESVLIFAASSEEIVSVIGTIADQLPSDLALRLRHVRNEYYFAYDSDGVFERCNGRTVGQILAEYQDPNYPPIVASGECDGVRYTLYAAPEETDGHLGNCSRAGKLS